MVKLKDQKKVVLVYLFFEIFEYFGKSRGIGYLNNTLNLPNGYIVIHDTIMNIAAQTVGLALSQRLQIIINSGHFNSEKG